MSVIKTLVILTSAILAVSESKFVETLSKCSIKDNACQKALVSSSLASITEQGIPELNIPPIDPYAFKNIKLSILDLVELTMQEGSFKGVKNCVVESFETEIEKGYSKMALTCNDLVIKGKYVVSGSNPILKNLFNGDSIHGEGTTKVKIEKVNIIIHYFYDISRNKDGDTYFDCKFDKTFYEYEIVGKVSFDANNIFLGETDATKMILDFMNSNYKFVVGTFGKTIFDKAMEMVYDHTHKFFDVVPSKHFIIEDLSQYVKS